MSGFLEQFYREILRRVAYGSLIGAALVWLLITSSAWKSAGAALSHADAATSVALAGLLPRGEKLSHQVVIVAIDDSVYRSRFGSRSPLDRKVLQEVVTEILDNIPPDTRIAIDLDVSPTLPEGVRPEDWSPDELDRLWLRHRERVVLVRPIEGPDPLTPVWIEKLAEGGCGVEFARPTVPEVFGLVDIGHDFADSLAAQVTKAPRSGCVAPGASNTAEGREANSVLRRTALDASVLDQPMTVPATPGFGAALSALAPRVVFLGGTWGPSDTFRTPFGQRFGLQVHAARAAGHLQGRITAPAWLQVLAAIVAAALAVSGGRSCARWLARKRGARVEVQLRDPAGPEGAGPVVCRIQSVRPPLRWSVSWLFAAGSLRRFAVLLWIVLLMMLLYLLTAAAHAWGGVWMPTLIVFGFASFSVSAAWVVDITRPLQVERPIVVVDADRAPALRRAQETPGHGRLKLEEPSSPPPSPWQEVSRPLASIMGEIRSSFCTLTGRTAASRRDRRLARELLCLSLLHLCGRTILPLAAVLYIVTRP